MFEHVLVVLLSKLDPYTSFQQFALPKWAPALGIATLVRGNTSVLMFRLSADRYKTLFKQNHVSFLSEVIFNDILTSRFKTNIQLIFLRISVDT